MERGQRIPELDLPDQDGRQRTLQDLAGPKGLVLYAYPKDDTPGCTIEAQEFRDLLPELRDVGYGLAGISRDPADSHCRFIDKYALTFPLLTDRNAGFLEAIGAYGDDGKTVRGIIRSTVVVDREGRVLAAYSNVKAQGHAARLLAGLKGA